MPRISDGNRQDTPHSTIREQFRLLVKQRPANSGGSTNGEIHGQEHAQQIHVAQLIQHYRKGGHLKAKTDPLGLAKPPSLEHLDLHFHGLTQADLDCVFSTGDLFFGKETATLKEIINDLEATYCGSIGAEFTHINEINELKWLQERMESARGRPSYAPATRLSIFCLLYTSPSPRDRG